MSGYQEITEVRRKWTFLILLILFSRATAMILSAVASVLFARSLGAGKIGLSGVVIGCANFGIVLVNLLQAPALIVEFNRLKSPQERACLLADSTVARLVVGLGFAIVAPALIRCLYHDDELPLLAWYVVPLICAAAVTPSWFFQAIEAQGIQALVSLTAPVTSVSLALIALRYTTSVGVDLWISGIAVMLTSVVGWLWIFRLPEYRRVRVQFRFGPTLRRIFWQSRWLALAAIAGYIYLSFEEQIVAMLCAPAKLGTYRTAKISADAVNSFFTVSSVLLFPRFIAWRESGFQSFRRKATRLAVVYCFVGLAVVASAIWLVPWLHPLLFGPGYHDAVVPCCVLIASKCVVLVAGVFSWGLLSAERNYRSVALVMMCSSVISLALNFVLIPRFELLGAAWTVFVCEVANGCAYGILFYRERPEPTPPVSVVKDYSTV